MGAVAALPFVNFANFANIVAIFSAMVIVALASIKVLNHLDKCKISAAHLAAIIALKLAALLSPLAGNTSLHRGNNLVK